MTTITTKPGIARAAAFFEAFAEPGRLAILSLLNERGPMIVKEVQAELGMSQSVASRNLMVLRWKKAVECERDGSTVRYWIANSSNTARVLEAIGL